MAKISSQTTIAALMRISGECGDLGAFVRRCGEALLLFAGRQQELREAQREWQLTEPTGGRRAGGELRGDLSLVVVHPMPASRLTPWTVTVGRSGDNELALDDESVSTYHAVFTRGSGGSFLLRDAGSATGTFVNEVLVVQQPVRLQTGDLVRFGSVVLTFMLAADAFPFVRNLAQASGQPALSSRELFDDLTPGTTGAHPLSPTVPMVIEAVQQIEAGRLDLGRRMLADVLAAEPDSRSARLWLAVVEARQQLAAGELERARAAYEAVLALDDAHQEARRELSVLRHRLRRAGR